MTTLELAFTQEYQSALLKLDNKQQSDVTKAVLKLQKGLESGHLHKLQGVPFHAFGVNQNALRIICKQDNELLILLHVAAHDVAYQWASRHKVKRVGPYVRLIRTTSGEEATGAATDEQAPEGPLASVPDKTFRHFRVEPPAAAVLRGVPDEAALIELLSCFREPLAVALLGLYTDPDNLQRLVRDFEDELRAAEAREAVAPTPVVPLKEALEDPVNSASFWVAPSDGKLLEAALSRPLEAWRVFLHPSQQRMVTLKTRGAYRVTGGPGTGKTVVALHRVRHLLEHTFKDDAGVVLLTTFSRVLAGELRRSMALLCYDKPELLQRVEVKTITQVAQDVLTDAGEPSSFLEEGVLDACWQKAMRFEGLGRDEAFYKAEREHVVARNGAWTQRQYLSTRREGRRSRINRVQRMKVWKVLEAFEQALATRLGGDTASLARRATELVVTDAAASPYLAVVCDESQDVSASDLRLLAALARDRHTGKTRPDSLYLVGDNYQSLYRAPIVLSRCGIEVRGQASILRRNYRTTEGIRRAAIEVVKGIDFDENEDEGDLDVLTGYTSVRGGPRPERHSFDTPEAEADWIVAQAQGDEGAWPLLVLTRTNRWLQALAERFKTRGVSPKLLGPHESLSGDDRVVLCSLHRSKGLEAPRVIIAGRHFIPQPWPGKGDAGDKLIWERQERCLLYVGMTRARDWCALTGVRKSR